MGAGLGFNMARPQGRPQMQRQPNTGPSYEPTNMVPKILEDFFGYDPETLHSGRRDRPIRDHVHNWET